MDNGLNSWIPSYVITDKRAEVSLLCVLLYLL